MFGGFHTLRAEATPAPRTRSSTVPTAVQLPDDPIIESCLSRCKGCGDPNASSRKKCALCRAGFPKR